LADVYTESNRLLEPKPDETPQEQTLRDQYDQERRELYRQWDEGDKEVRELWLRTRQWSLDELQDILDTLNVRIDVFFFESEQEEPSKQIVDELIEARIAEDERPEGPVIVKIDDLLGLKKEKYRTAVILRSDGTTLYLTKDLALAKQKIENYHVDRSLYVVDVRQTLHFQQVFSILELWGFPQSKMCVHVPYGFVSLPEGAMSSRKGNVVLFKDVEAEAIHRVQEIIKEKNPSLSEGERVLVAKQVGLGALAFSMLSVDNNKDIVFKWEDALNFDGKSAPYIQNAFVRANSILKKADGTPVSGDFSYPLAAAEIELIDQVSRFPTIISQAAADYKPLHIANYAYELAKTFHGFYQSVPVLKAETEEIRNARLRLVAATRQTIGNALNLLVIEAPEVM
jgi:arginyl-tRNA synthetase